MFQKAQLNIVALDANGTLLSHPYRPEAVGQNRLNDIDPNGVAYARILQNLAKRGGGFDYTVRPNPAHSNAMELKLNYVLKVDDGLYLQSGMYLPGPAPIFRNESRKDLIAFVKSARDFALNHTKGEALKAFNDKNGKFVRGDLYIYAYDFKGNTLALPFEPEAVGTNRIDFQEPNGMYLLQGLIDTAKSGNGLSYVIYKDPAENMAYKLKLRYVTKVNDEWFLGSGIYLPEA